MDASLALFIMIEGQFKYQGIPKLEKAQFAELSFFIYKVGGGRDWITYRGMVKLGLFFKINLLIPIPVS